MTTEHVFRTDAYARSCAATVSGVDGRGIRLDRTVFYPAGGGQPGDRGTLAAADGTTVEIVDTIKGDDGDEVIHVPAEGAPALGPGTAVTATIDWERRHRHMRMHTAMHLLCSLVPGGVTGGQVGAEKSRLDFDLQGENLDKETLTEALNRLVEADHPVEPRWIDDAELEANPDLVRTMSVKPPIGAGKVRLVAIGDGTVDLQPCGGTHVARTGEVGRLVVSKIESKGKRNRRVNLTLAE